MGETNRALVVGHRGASGPGHAPENTMAAFLLAARLGADAIETDLRVTRDGHFVALHDATLERTTNGRGRAAEFTLAELRELDAGSWFGPEFVGEKIPALEEVFALGRETGMKLYLEVKYALAGEANVALVRTVKSSGIAERCVMLSFDARVLEELRRLGSGLRTGLLFDATLPEIEIAQSVGASELAPRCDLVTRELVSRTHDAGLAVATWTVNEAEEMRTVLAAGVDAVMSDYPDRVRDVMTRMGGSSAT